MQALKDVILKLKNLDDQFPEGIMNSFVQQL